MSNVAQWWGCQETKTATVECLHGGCEVVLGGILESPTFAIIAVYEFVNR